MGFPFKYDLRQVWTNFENVEEQIENIDEFIQYFESLSIESLIFNIGSSISEHDNIDTNYQILPKSLIEKLFYLRENLTIINVDPAFRFIDIIDQIDKLCLDSTILKNTNNLLHIRINIGPNTIDIILSKSLLPTYDDQGARIIKNYATKINDTSLLDKIDKYTANSKDKQFVIDYYNIIASKIEKSILANHAVVIINYALKFNLSEKGLYFGFFSEFLDMLSRFPDVYIFEYSSFRIDTLIYKNTQLKPRVYPNCVKYRAFNTTLHTGILDKVDYKHNNCILSISDLGKIKIEYINNDNKIRLLINY
jgi:hypothetical protein